MSAKPAAVPTWATDANYPAGAETYSATPTKVAPTGTRRSRGWEPKKKPPAQVENYERNLLGQWCQYLNDGALEGNFTITGDLQVDTLTVATNAEIGDLSVTGNAGIDGDLDVGGDLTVTGDATFDGEIIHGQMKLTVPLTHAYSYSGGVWSITLSSNVMFGTLLSGGNVLSIPILGLRNNDRIKSIRIRGSTTGGNEPTILIIDQVDDAAGSLTYSAVGTIVAGTKTMTLDTPLVLGADGEHVHIKITSGASFATTIYTISVVFDRYPFGHP